MKEGRETKMAMREMEMRMKATTTTTVGCSFSRSGGLARQKKAGKEKGASQVTGWTLLSHSCLIKRPRLPYYSLVFPWHPASRVLPISRLFGVYRGVRKTDASAWNELYTPWAWFESTKWFTSIMASPQDISRNIHEYQKSWKLIEKHRAVESENDIDHAQYEALLRSALDSLQQKVAKEDEILQEVCSSRKINFPKRNTPHTTRILFANHVYPDILLLAPCFPAPSTAPLSKHGIYQPTCTSPTCN